MTETRKIPSSLKVLLVASILLFIGLVFIPIYGGDYSYKALGVLLLLYALTVFYAMKQIFFTRFTPKDFDTYLTEKADEAKGNKQYKTFLFLSTITPMVTVGLATLTLLLIVMIFVL